MPAAGGRGPVRRADEPGRAPGAFEVGDWERTWEDDAYGAAVEAVAAAIAAGDVYQVNLVQHLSAPFRGDPAGLAGRARAAPAARAPAARRRGLGDRLGLARAVPRAARPARVDDADQGHAARSVATRPAPARCGQKDAAEHVMIVDLERNDLSRVCEPGSVRWPELMVEGPGPASGTCHDASRAGCARTSG